MNTERQPRKSFSIRLSSEMVEKFEEIHRGLGMESQAETLRFVITQYYNWYKTRKAMRTNDED